ncbi:hypothetical protein HanIR_Chr11g0528901 [Helianthus annuus]|nr:hypothetical protein HanIR_Chr11g0528901 [Helianthus annuus]
MNDNENNLPHTQFFSIDSGYSSINSGYSSFDSDHFLSLSIFVFFYSNPLILLEYHPVSTSNHDNSSSSSTTNEYFIKSNNNYPNITNLMPIALDNTNFLNWQHQINCFKHIRVNSSPKS